MRLNRVHLRNYRGIVDRDVRFSQNGVTIVEGPNEIGKTAISEGLQLAIDLPDSSKHARVKSVQPVGSDEGPEVEISLSSGDYELIYRKRWLRQPYTVLELKAPHHESVAGKEAHDRLKAILAETLDDQLWQALRIEQGTELTLPNLSLPSMGKALDRAAGGDLAADNDENIWARITEEFEKYWTPTGQAKKERKTSEQTVEEARNTVAKLRNQLEEIESDADELSRLQAESTRLSKTIKECVEREQELQKQSNTIDSLRSKVERLEAIHSVSEAKRDGTAKEWKQRQSLISSFEESASELASLESEAQTALPGIEAAVRRKEEADIAQDAAETEAQKARSRLDRATADEEHLRQLIEVEQLKERHSRYLAAEEKLKQAEAYLETAQVDDEVAKQIDEAFIEAEKAKASADSAAARVEITALNDISIMIGAESIELAANEINQSLVEKEATLTIPSIAQIRVSAGPESRDFSEQRRNTLENYRLLCEKAGVSDTDGARRAAQNRQDAQRNKDEAVQAIKRDLRDFTPDILLGKVESLTKKVASYPKERLENPPLPVDLDEAQSIKLEWSNSVKVCDETLNDCKYAARNAAAELDAAQRDEIRRTERIDNARKTKSSDANRLALEREQQTDEVLLAAVAADQKKETEDRQSLDEAQAKLSDADPDTVETLLDNAKHATKRATDDLQSNKDRQNQLRTSLDLRGQEGLYTAHDEANNQLSYAKREHERQEARAEAARLLRDIFEKHRQQAHQNYIEPFKESIDRLGRIVFGPTFAVELNEDIQIVSRTLEGTTLDINQLSTGAREQLGVISRLACATIVSPDDNGAPVMIDDALGWSDPQRLMSMGAAIAAAGKQCQVVVLTCTPGRYSHVGNAKVVSL